MAVTNSTENQTKSSVLGLGALGFLHAQNEKISCSFGDFSSLNPLELLGSHVIFEEYCPASGSVPGSIHSYGALVMAVQVGSVVLGVESQLLLKHDGSDVDDWVPLPRLTVLSVD